MESPLRSDLIGWLASDPSLSGQLNAVTEEAPSRTSLPWLAISASSSADWSTKTEIGFDTRIALELHCRGDTPDSANGLIMAIMSRVMAMPADQTGYRIVTRQFLRSRCEQRGESNRAALIEFRFHTLLD